VWKRNIPWGFGFKWRTDMCKSVLSDARLQMAVFTCKSGLVIKIAAEELRRVLPLGPSRYGNKIWGAFTINVKDYGFSNLELATLCNRLWNVQAHFGKVL
jgi:hypothetical protein